ncbi:Crp/Fnr family transcriptional regulator [Desulfotomaculum nigrificans]|uniref:Crp/Fnr family transcriptional regulator n=1 Tax=Desulfotomaculum nigrificans TaxID=1565 RepID=UPI0001FAEEC8|nr:Crp/Fnr family transcriptional regulator [Desulfotomaculum nigrificans]
MTTINLTKNEEKRLGSVGFLVKYPKGQIIFTAGQRTNEVYFIKSGWVRIYRTISDGRQVTVALRYPGDFIGLAEIFSGTGRECCAEAMDDVSLYIIWGEEFKRLLAESPEFSAKIMQLMGARLRESQNTIHDFISNHVHGRLALVLKNMAERSGKVKDDIIHVRLRITQEELACMVGAARQTVSSTLTLFKEEGCIIYEGRDIVAVNPQKLASWIE